MNAQHWLAAAFAAFAISGCNSFTPDTYSAGTLTLRSPVWTDDGLYLVDRAGPGLLFITHPMTELNHYEGLFIDDIEIRSKEGTPDLRAKEEEWLRGYCRRAIQRVFKTSDWSIVDERGDGVMQVRMAVTDLEFRRTYLDGGSSATLNPSGGITVVLELRDSVNDRRLLLFTEKRELPFGVYLGPGHIELERIEDALLGFTRDVQVNLDAARHWKLPKPAGPRPEAPPHGQ